ncbi:hypothetical protein ACFQ0K_06815 [Nocardioides caeni]|uniref:Uncharacterized protein n=1 Tax=Nocardioides caeni TaxID=574700 RepID=A0A4S8NAD9_9ACTN|nr:hypothetical protein [Nocardioides caeni]THV12872.1 hypothetical protein E9934_10775 [Nocardioides caeni]
MTGAARRPAVPGVRLDLLVLLLAVLGAVLFLAPGGDRAEPAPAPDSEAGPADAPATPSGPAPSEEAFCSAYRDLAAAQGQYVAQMDERGAELLRETADELVALGVPDSMSVLARTGFRLELSGIYGSIGLALDPTAVPGALTEDGDGTSLSGSAGEFGAWLSELCPAR